MLFVLQAANCSAAKAQEAKLISQQLRTTCRKYSCMKFRSFIHLNVFSCWPL